MGCAGRVANGINTVHLSYVRQYRGHGLIGFRQWIPREHIEDPAVRAGMGLPEDLAFATKGELAVQILTGACADGMMTDFVCGDEVYGSSPALRSDGDSGARRFRHRSGSHPRGRGGVRADRSRARGASARN